MNIAKVAMKTVHAPSLLLLLFSCYVQAITITHGPYLQNVKDDEATIVWCSDKPSVGWVEMVPDGSDHFYAEERPRFYDTRIGIKQTGCVHAVTLKGLTPDSRYRYRVFAREVLSHEGHHVIYGNTAATEVYQKQPLFFSTSNARADATAFAMVNDIHARNEVLEKLISQCDLKQTDFFIFNGDMVSSVENEAQMMGGFLDKSVELFASEIPFYYVRGNHETRGAFADHFKDYFSPHEAELYYMVRRGPVCFLMLDCGENKPDSVVECPEIADYDYYRTVEAEWLKEAVNSEAYRSAAYRIIVTHIPPEKESHGEMEALNKFVPILNDARVDVMLCGHLHLYRNMPADDTVRFPILINSNNSILKGTADKSGLHLQVIDTEGEQIDRFSIAR